MPDAAPVNGASFEHATGEGALPKVILRAADGATAEIYLHGAHVSSWKPAPDADERLFLSARSEFRAGVAIRGGIPVIFPQFSEGPLPRHGLARTRRWTLASLDSTETGIAVATFVFVDDDETRIVWPAEFLATLAVRVGGPQLSVALAVENTGKSPFTFAAALHTYLRVRDIANALLVGLHGSGYRVSGDKVMHFDIEESIRFRGAIDRVYANAPRRVILRDTDRSMRIESTDFPDMVVWNPGRVAAETLADMEPGGEAHMVCVECAAINSPILLDPDRRWSGSQILVAEPFADPPSP